MSSTADRTIPERPEASAAGNLDAQGLRKEFTTRAGGLVVLRDVSLTVGAGQSVAVMGPSGSGKSTLLNILATLDPPTAGKVVIGGCDPFLLPSRELARFRNRHIGLVFQEHYLLPQCSALENVIIPTLPDPREPGAEARARSLLERVGLADRMDHLPAELSGGERQRVAIARALINHPTVLLADEPTGNLDRGIAGTVADLLVEVHREQKTILVVVTHNPGLAERFDRRYELADGVLQPQ